MPSGANRGPAAIGLIEGGSYSFAGGSGPFPGPHKVVIDIDAPEGGFNAATLPTGGPKARLTNAEALSQRGAARPAAGTNQSNVHFVVDYTVPDGGSRKKDFEF